MRKFTRRTSADANSYQVKTKRGYSITGKLGDGVDNRIAVYRDYEPGASDFIASHAAKADCFVDIGCNVGWFSCLVASLPSRPTHIVSIDANPAMVESCKRNLALNAFTSATRVCAIGHERGSVTFHIPERRHSRASIGSANANTFGAGMKSITVDMVPLAEIIDTLPLGRCDLMKMDIEGFELAALRVLPRETALKIGLIVMEYTTETLAGCGFPGMTLGVLPWLDAFSVHTLNNDGTLDDVKDPVNYSPEDTTFVLKNRTWAV